jgi:phospholipid transport system substrate-binding protein
MMRKPGTAVAILSILGVLALGSAGVVLAVPRMEPAGPATDTLRPAIDEVLRVLTDPGLSGTGRKAQRKAAMRAVMERTIDFPDAARRALAVHWAARTPEERTEFVRLFEDLVIASYTTQLDGYGVERVVFVGESHDEDLVTVHTRADSRQRVSVPIDYRMHRREGRWLVYDVLVEGVSLVGNYRAQFNTVIRTQSYAELVHRMKAQAAG